MKSSRVLSSSIALAILVLALPGQAQPRGAATTGQTPDVLPPAESGGNGPASDAPAPVKKPMAPAAGYAYGDKQAASTKAAPRARYRSHGPVVNMPGFEQTTDGGSRLFVQLTQSVPVEERKGQNTITYVLKGASPRVWNNTNALVTVHFNTPVSRARLVPQGKDLLFVVDLRAGATPTWRMDESPDKGATLAIDFPKGDYLHAGAEPAKAEADPAARPAARRGRAGKRAPAALPTAPAPAKTEAPPSGAKP